MNKLKGILAQPKWPAMMAIGWLILFSLLWRGELITDDLLHRTMLQGSESLYAMGFDNAHPDRSFSEKIDCLFCFVTKGEGNVQKFKEMGVVPWWTGSELQVSFWRPFSALTHWLDYQLWPDNPTLMLYHSLIWYAGLIFLVGCLFRRLQFLPWVAGLAVLIFALDASFIFPMKWLANRNAVITAFWGVMTLILHVRWRKGEGIGNAVLSQLTLMLALLSGEGGIAIIAYLFAFALCLDEASYRSRILSLLPACVVIVGWRVIYKSLEYGAYHSGMYLDPFNDTSEFLLGVLDRGVVLLFFQYSGIDIIYNMLSPNGKVGLWMFSMGFLSVVAVTFTPLLKQTPLARFLLVGSVIAVIPACACAMPSGRLLFLVSIGASGLVAMFIAGASDSTSRAARYLRRYYIVMHLVVSLLVWVGGSVALLVIERPVIPKELALDTVDFDTSKQVILLTVPNPFLMSYLSFYREYAGLATLQKPRVLAPAYAKIELTRVGLNTILLKAEHGLSLLPMTPPSVNIGSVPVLSPVYSKKSISSIFRANSSSFEAEETIELSDMKVTINQVDGNGEPTNVTIGFQSNLDGYEWLAWDKDKELYVKVQLPIIGASMSLVSSLK